MREIEPVATELPGLGGGSVLFRSIWQIDIGTDFPRLITLYPRTEKGTQPIVFGTGFAHKK